MRNTSDIQLIKAIIHILDTSMEEPVYNNDELELDEEVMEFVNGHITRCTSDDEAKCAVFNDDSSLIKRISREVLQDMNTFVENSKEIARNFFEFMKVNVDMPSGDLLIALFNCEYGPTLGIMKLDYNKTYIHNIDYVGEKMVINIMPQMIGLPGKGQKLQKSIFINLDNEEHQILMVDRNAKKSSVEGEYAPQTLLDFINCSSIVDKRDATRNIIDTSEKWIRKNIKDDAETAERARTVISRAIKSEDVVNLESVAQEAFGKNEELKKEYIESLVNAGMENLEVAIDRQWVEDKLKRKKLKVDKDIEIYIDSNVYEDSSRFEIKRNGDGTINIVIKHVRNYIEKA